MKFMLVLSFLLALYGCSDSPKVNNDAEQESPENEKDNKNLDFETRIKREIEAKLSIPATEKYTLEIHKAHLNADEKEDAVITVNRLEFAMEEASQGQTAKRAEFGYMGNYNFFFFYDGQLDKISVPVTVASSAKSPLRVSFDNIQSEIYKDVIIEYRIRNSAFRNYYQIENGSLMMVFQWKLFDFAGTDNYEANFIEYQPGTYSLAKDIVIYQGTIKNYNKQIPDVYKYNPVIEKGGKELYRFFFDPGSNVYATNKK